MITYPCGRELIDQLRPILESGRLEVLLDELEQRWPSERLRESLEHLADDGIKIALFCLSLVGTMDDAPAVARRLHHPDTYIAKLAENTMWSIWFRAGDASSNLALSQAVQMIGENRLDEARDGLSALLERRPDFAEAYNQRSIALFLQGCYAPACEDLRSALRLNPLHFAALAGLGHCHAAECQWTEALDCYQRALAIHPRVDGLPGLVAELMDTLARREAKRARRSQEHSSDSAPTTAWAPDAESLHLPPLPLL